eukprot:scaffold32.g3815.t1
MAKIQARVPDEIQDVASAVIKSTGLTVSDAVRMFMMRIARDRALPLDLFQPSSETLQAIEDAEAGRLTPTTIEGILADIEEAQREGGTR